MSSGEAEAAKSPPAAGTGGVESEAEVEAPRGGLPSPQVAEAIKAAVSPSPPTAVAPSSPRPVKLAERPVHDRDVTALAPSPQADPQGSSLMRSPEPRRGFADDSLDGFQGEEDRFAISHLHRRQAEWDRQMEFHDQKQSELVGIQWKLVREQTGTLARELGIIQQQMKEMKSDSRRSVLEADRLVRESEAKISEERVMRQALAESTEQRFKKAKQDLDAEAKQRAASDAEVGPKLMALEEGIAGRTREHRSLEFEVSKLNKAMEVVTQEIEAMREALDQEADERRANDDSAMEMMRELRDMVLKENRDRLALQEDHGRSAFNQIEQLRADFLQANGLLKDKLTAFQKEMAPFREEIPPLKSRLQELETSTTARLKESLKGIERELSDRATVQQKIERRLTEMSAAAEKEQAARHAMVEDVDTQLKSFRTKVKGLVTEQTEAARLAREELHSQLLDNVERETAMREAQVATLTDQWNTHKTSVDVRIDALEEGVRNVEQRTRDERSNVEQEVEAAHQRQAEAVSRQVREMSEAVQGQIEKERGQREQQLAAAEEHIERVDSFIQDLREVFVSKGSRSRIRRSTPSASSRPEGGMLPVSTPRDTPALPRPTTSPRTTGGNVSGGTPVAAAPA